MNNTSSSFQFHSLIMSTVYVNRIQITQKDKQPR